MSNVVIQDMSFKKGQVLTVSGVPNVNCTNFYINVGNSAGDIALHVNPRFNYFGDKQKIVCNSLKGGNFGEEYRTAEFPFNEGETFKIKITFTAQEFKIVLHEGSEFRFPNRSGGMMFKYLEIKDAQFRGIEIM